MALAVCLGAFGAHGLKDRLDAYSMSVYEKAVFYHFVHALGILLVVVLARTGLIGAAGQDRVAWLLLAGIVVFSGSLYALAISGMRILGAITPIGGLAFIAGWALLAYEAVRACTRLTADSNDCTTAHAVRKIVAAKNVRRDVILLRLLQLGLYFRPFVQQQLRTALQRLSEQIEKAVNGSNRARRDDVRRFPGKPRFRAIRDDTNVSQIQRFYHRIHEARFFLNRFRQGKAGVRQNHRERDARKSGARTGIHDCLCF